MAFIDTHKRKRIFERYHGLCDECGRQLQNSDFTNLESYATVDHIIPKSRGGSNNDRNLRLLCRKCNMKRGNDYSALEFDVRTQIAIDRHASRKKRRQQCRNATIKKKRRYTQIAGYCNEYIGKFYIEHNDNDVPYVKRSRSLSVSHRQKDAKHLTNRRLRRLKPKEIYENDYEDYGLDNSANYRRYFNYSNYVD